MDLFAEFRKALEQSREKKALALFDELYAKKKEFYRVFRQLVLAGARHKPGRRETHAFLPLSASLQSMQFLRSREEVAVMMRRLIRYLCALDQEKTTLERPLPDRPLHEHTTAMVHAAATGIEEKPERFALACAAKELADYVGQPDAQTVLAARGLGFAPSPESFTQWRTPKREPDEILLAASARAGAANENLVWAACLLKSRRLFSPKAEAHLLAWLERKMGAGKKALTPKSIDQTIGKTHGELALGEDEGQALLEHLLEPNPAHALYVLRELIEWRVGLRTLYPAFLIGGYSCGPVECLDALVAVNAACQVAERIEKPLALIPLAQAVQTIAARLKAGQRVEIPSKTVFPWE
ncbi:MAG: hypothetical protein J4203_03565 [Candidatus Diapherotrites archaeon]|uniref:Uncharacterized protein n=2 Tax=Candidatus Iainarchaeum sp. TaxID=3101447 RepID=A0A8T4LJ65_9ARCH|nr:hypothetical protein [Candidatus Diapherotrites archaeon]